MKKLICSAMALLMASTMFVGCGKRNVSDHNGGKITEPTTVAPTIIPEPTMTTPMVTTEPTIHTEVPHTTVPNATEHTMVPETTGHINAATEHTMVHP